MPGEHEVPEFDGTAEPWRSGKRLMEDALASATGITVALPIAMLLRTLLAWIIDRVTLVTATG